MGTAELAPSQPRIDLAQRLEPGFQTETGRGGLLPRQGGALLMSNLVAEIVPPDQLPNPRPDRVLYGTVRDPRLQVVKPIPLEVSVEESTVAVSWGDVGEFGTGGSLSAAIDDFDSSLRDLYHQLFAPDAKLGADLQQIKEALGQYIQPRK